MLGEEFGDDEVVSTAFRATVSRAEPYQFGQYVTQDVNASVRVTHVVYTPPTSRAAWDAYYAAYPSAAAAASPVFGKSTVSVTAKVRTLQLDGSIASYVIACFPLDSRRISELEVASAALKGASLAAATSASFSPPLPTTRHVQRFGGLFDIVVPVPSDIAAGLDIHLDVDASVELEVEGPGQVTFVGEQYSALIPEWMNHRMFRVGAGDEELPEGDDEEDDDLSESELAEMHRLAR